MWEIVGFSMNRIDILKTNLSKEEAIEEMKSIKKTKPMKYGWYDTIIRIENIKEEA